MGGSPASAWKSRTIYQVLTDRYNNPSRPSCDLKNYCGGTFAGIAKQLDYIVDMGFDAIWISPVVVNTPGGYHGYWAKDLFNINPNFGTPQDLKDLVEACHARGVWVMVDIVCNHMGNDPSGVTSSGFSPFNQTSNFHDCSGCPSNCQIQDFTNQAQVEHCRLAGLPDIDQSQAWVTQQLVDYVATLLREYEFDGIRADTVPEVSKTFWSHLQGSVGGTYIVGEVYNGNVGYVSGYQGVIDATLSYPLFFTLRNVFAQKQSMYGIQSMVQSYAKSFSDVDALGTFIDNHDQPRFLNARNDQVAYKAAMLYTLMSSGVPIIYYGSEQAFSGGNDPANREPLWPTGFNQDADLYKWLATVVGFRKKAQVWNSPQVQRYADDTFYAFTRGTTFVAMTNVGQGGPDQSRSITYDAYPEGTKLCNLFDTSDCVTVNNKQFTVTLQGGESKVYFPGN